MPLQGLEHFTINCRDLEATRDFYRDVLGLKEGFRPAFNFAGHWMYCGDAPVVHLVGADGTLKENREADMVSNTGAFDHVAFRGNDVQAMVANLKHLSIAFRESQSRNTGLHQLFVRDPNGIMVEINFRN